MDSKSDTIFAQLETFVAQAMDKNNVPGAVVGVWQNNETHILPFGVTNVDHPLPVTEDTLFQVGSITKTFTALLLMQLVEQGKIDLDATIQSYLPNFRVADETVSKQATIRHLLTHTAGWVGDLFEDTGEGDDAYSRYVARMADLEQLAPLGELYSYNNAAFYLAGAIIETVTGRFYEDVLRQMVLEPLGMSHSYLKSWDVMTFRFAIGHNVHPENGVQTARPWMLPRAVHSVGGLITTVSDLLRYAQFQMGDGNGIVTAVSLQQLHAPQAQIWGDDETIGLSWFINDMNGVRVLSHGGGTKGQVSYLFIVPEHSFAAAIVTNSEHGGQVTQATYRWLLREALGLDAPEQKATDADAETLAEYVGQYERPFANIELFMEADQLMGQIHYKQGFPSKDTPQPPNPPPMPLALAEKDRLLITAGSMKNTRVDIIRRQDSSIGWLRAGRLHRKTNFPN